MYKTYGKGGLNWKLENLKVEYSVDMIRLKNNVYSEFFKPFMDRFSYNPNVEYYISTNFKKYKHNWHFEDEKGSFWLAYRHNQENGGGQAYNAVIEFNPNKVQESPLLHEILKKFFNPNSNYIISSCDIAIDLHDVDMEKEIFWDKGKKQNYTIYHKGGSKTVYLGSGANRVKLYDKANEQNLKDEKWTRYEISMKVDYTYNTLNDFEYEGCLPKIWVVGLFKYDMDLTSTDWFILQALMQGCGTIDQLGRRKRKKIRTALDKQSSFVPDKSQLSRTLRDYVYNSLDKMIIPKKQKV